MVALDVSVADQQGNPVLDLTRDDFNVLENGKQQQIIAFEGPQPPTSANTIINSTADLEKLPNMPVTVLVLDQMNGLFDENAYSRISMENYLKEAPATFPQATALMVETNHSFEILCDFTRDRNRLRAALSQLKAELPTRRIQGGAAGTAAIERELFTLNAIQQIAEAFAGHPGRKNIIWVGNALPRVNTQMMPDEDTVAIDTTVQRTLNILLKAHAVLYTIDPRANTSGTTDLSLTLSTFGADTPNEFAIANPGWTTDPLNAGQNFDMVAAGSGGMNIVGRNAIDKVIGEVLRSGTSFYTLFYRPTQTSDLAQQYRNIAVHVSRPHLVLSSRLGYYANTPSETQAAMETPKNADGRSLLELDLSSAVTDGLTYTALHLISPHMQSAGKISFEIPPHSLTWNTESATGDESSNLIIVLATLDGRGRIVTHHSFSVTAKSSNPDSPTTLDFPFFPDTKSRTLRIVVREVTTGKMGSASLPLNITK